MHSTGTDTFIHGAGERVVSVRYCAEPTDYLIGRGKASGDEKKH